MNTTKTKKISHKSLIENGWEKLPKKYNHHGLPAYKKDNSKIVILYTDSSVCTVVNGYNTYFSFVEGVSKIIHTIQELEELERNNNSALTGWEKLLTEI